MLLSASLLPNSRNQAIVRELTIESYLSLLTS